MKIAEQIFRLRSRAGMSQEELADLMEVSRQSVSKWETGTSVPEIDKLVKMSALFGVSLDELVTGNAPAPEQTQEKPVTLGKILGAAMLVLAGICLAVTVMFEGTFGFHISQGVLLAVWFALLGAIALDPENEMLRVGCTAVYGMAAMVLTVLYFLRIFSFQGVGIFVLIGITLAGWAWYAGRAWYAGWQS